VPHLLQLPLIRLRMALCQRGAQHRDGTVLFVKRVSWERQDSDEHEKKQKSFNMGDTIQSVTSDLVTAQADISFLKREQSKVIAVLKQLLEKPEVNGESLGLKNTAEHALVEHEGDLLKREFGKLQDAQENEAKQRAADVNELKNWVARKVDAWEKSKKETTEVLQEKDQVLLTLQANLDDAQKKLEASVQAVAKDCETLKVDCKQCLQNQNSALQSDLRSQMVTVHAEFRAVKSSLEREKNAREKGYRHLISRMEWPSSTKSFTHNPRKHEIDSPAMDQVAKKVADLALQLEAEVVTRAAKLGAQGPQTF